MRVRGRLRAQRQQEWIIRPVCLLVTATIRAIPNPVSSLSSIQVTSRGRVRDERPMSERGELRQTCRCHLFRKASRNPSPRHSRIPRRAPDRLSRDKSGITFLSRPELAEIIPALDPGLPPTGLSIKGGSVARVQHNNKRSSVAITKDCNYEVCGVSVSSSGELQRASRYPAAPAKLFAASESYVVAMIHLQLLSSRSGLVGRRLHGITYERVRSGPGLGYD